MRKNFDLIIPLGHACVCSSILRKHHQFCSYPLDWVRTISLDQGINLLATNFKNFLDSPDDLILLDTSNENTKHYLNKRNNIRFLHDFPSNIPLTKSFETVKQKYNRRIERLYRHLSLSTHILFVNVAEKCEEIPDISDKYYLNQYRRLQNLFPDKDINLVCLIMTHKPYKNKFFELKELSPHITRANCFYQPQYADDIWSGHFNSLVKVTKIFRLNYKMKLRSLLTKHGFFLFLKKFFATTSRKTLKFLIKISTIFILNKQKRRIFRKKYTSKINKLLNISD